MLTHISFTPLILGILCLGLIYTICLSLFQYWRLRHIPGPKLAWTNLWLMWHMNSEEPFHNTKKRLNDRYGPVQRYGPNRVMFSGLSAVSVILGTSNILPKVCLFPSYHPQASENLITRIHQGHDANLGGKNQG
jgi:hypothetical protein